jgi:hypothetical protein
MQLRLSQLETALPTVLEGTATPVTISALTTLGNTRIHPERSREFEGGAEMSLWGDRVQLTLTGYDKLRKDAIQRIPVAPSISSGVGEAASVASGSYYANVGDIRNRGVEASVDTRLVDTRVLQWNVNGQFSRNRNTLIRSGLGGAIPKNVSVGLNYFERLVPGYPIDGIWAKPILGYQDVNGDGILQTSEVRVGDSLVYVGVGSGLPKYEVTLNTRLGFLDNRVSINTSVDYQAGVTQFMGGGTLNCGNRGGTGTGRCSLRWLNDPALSADQFAAIVAGRQTGIGLAQTASVLRWNTLSVNYVVSQRISQRLRLPYLSLALQGRNLALHTNYRGKDPNVNAITSGNFTRDTGQLPQPRLWSFSVRIGN